MSKFEQPSFSVGGPIKVTDEEWERIWGPDVLVPKEEPFEPEPEVEDVKKP